MTSIVRLKDGVYGLNNKPYESHTEDLFLYTLHDDNYVFSSATTRDEVLAGLGLSEEPETLYISKPYETCITYCFVEEPTVIPTWSGCFNYGTSAYINLTENQFNYILIGAEND